MKKLPAILIIALFFSSTINAQSKWDAASRSNFINSCVKSASAAMSQDSAKFYCYCMMNKIEDKYPDPKEADKITQAELNSPEFKNMMLSCLGGYWTNAQRNEFVASCIKEAKAGMSEPKAKNYCECMMYNIEARYHNYDDANKLTTDDFSSPEWLKIIRRCLE